MTQDDPRDDDVDVDVDSNSNSNSNSDGGGGGGGGVAFARNIELKARVHDVQAVLELAAAVATEGPYEIIQDDTFFRCDSGRLKLRAFSDNDGELIFYRRDNQAGPKQSFYLRSPTTAPQVLRDSLALAYGIVGRVRKRRILFLAGRTRIHVDRVAGLGDFVELEVVLGGEDASGGNDTVAAAEREARELMQALQIDESQLVDVAYVDLLGNAGGRDSHHACQRDSI